MDPLEKITASTEIENCLKRYARGVDRRDWDMVRGCFHFDATDHHGEFHGTVDEFITWVSKRHEFVPFSMHYLLNCLIEFQTSDVAFVETYFWAIQRRDATDQAPDTDFEVFGRYVDRFEKRFGVWRVAQRQVAYDSTRQTASTHHLRKLVGVIGQRDKTDAIYQQEQSPELQRRAAN
jgi:hypothetical protein